MRPIRPTSPLMSNNPLTGDNMMSTHKSGHACYETKLGVRSAVYCNYHILLHRGMKQSAQSNLGTGPRRVTSARGQAASKARGYVACVFYSLKDTCVH